MRDQARRSRRFSVWIAVLVALPAAVAAWIVFDPGFRSGRLAISTWGMSQDEFDRRIRDYLMEHPEVIIQSVQRLEARHKRDDLAEVQDVLQARAEEIFRDPDSPVGGNAQRDVTLVEFFDYNRPYCRKMAPVLIEAEKADPRLRIVFKEFPILGLGSEFAARAALAAHRQGRYEVFHHASIGAQTKVNKDSVLAIAAEVGLDFRLLKPDMQDPSIQVAIDRNMALAAALQHHRRAGLRCRRPDPARRDEAERSAGLDQPGKEAKMNRAVPRQGVS